MHTYQNMKNSGVAWLGEIPSEWEQKQARYIFKQAKDTVGDNPSEYELLSLTLRGIIPRSQVDGGKNPENYDTYQVVREDDLIMCLFDYDVTPRTVGRATKTGMVTGAYTNLRPLEGVSTRYYNYFFLALDTTKELLHLCTGLRNGISKPTFFSLNLPVPNYETQEIIANYLDVETAKIDTLIDKQERLVTLLDEKYRADIYKAVTQGIGSQPAKWPAGKMYQYADLGSGTTPNVAKGDWFGNGTYPWVTTGELRESHINSTKQMVNQSAINNHSALKLYPAGTLLIAMYGATIGRLGILDVEATTNQACCAIRPKGKLKTSYMYYYLIGTRDELIYLSDGGGQPNISKDKIAKFNVVVPSGKEQDEIVSYLDDQTRKLDDLKSKVLDQIKLLKERRASLISNVVTGKAKV